MAWIPTSRPPPAKGGRKLYKAHPAGPKEESCELQRSDTRASSNPRKKRPSSTYSAGPFSDNGCTSARAWGCGLVALGRNMAFLPPI